LELERTKTTMSNTKLGKMN